MPSSVSEPSSKIVDAITQQYGHTILSLSSRLANLAANVADLSERNAAMAEKLRDLEDKLAASNDEKNAG